MAKRGAAAKKTGKGKKKDTPKEQTGRKCRYDPAVHPRMAGNYARDGLIDKEIAAKLGIAVSTLYAWQKKFPEFSESIKNGKEVIDYEVESALLKRALGYPFEETTVDEEYGLDNEGQLVLVGKKVKTTSKQLAGDVTAQIFWLKNRMPKKWMDKHHQHITGGGVDLSELSDDELEREYRELMGDGGTITGDGN